MTSSRRSALCLAVIAVALSAQAGHAAPPVRSEVPIKEMVLSDGARRYTVPITLGGTLVEAGLDTGSVGIRILPNVLAPADAQPTGGGDTYSYSSGAELDGVVGKTTATVGQISGPITVQLVRKVGCTDHRPGCVAGRIPQDQYGIQGDGLPGEGFKAILGVSMGDAEVDSPFRALGARRWIVELPRPGEAAPGRIILNPTDEEAAGYVASTIVGHAIGSSGAHDAVPGCLKNRTTKAEICGAVLLDSGAPGLNVYLVDGSTQPWPDNTPALLVFADTRGQGRAVEQLTIGLREHASRLLIARSDGRATLISAGLSPYFAFSVLYDPEHGTVAFKPRPPAPGGPQGVVVQ